MYDAEKKLHYNLKPATYFEILINVTKQFISC